jgi:hypothetical protein
LGTRRERRDEGLLEHALWNKKITRMMGITALNQRLQILKQSDDMA